MGGWVTFHRRVAYSSCSECFESKHGIVYSRVSPIHVTCIIIQLGQRRLRFEKHASVLFDDGRVFEAVFSSVLCIDDSNMYLNLGDDCGGVGGTCW